MRTQQQEVLQKLQWHQENLQHNISMKSGSLEWEESSSLKDKWTIKIKRQEMLIKGGV